MNFDDIITELGAFGPYQRRILLLCLYPGFLYSFYAMLPVFILADHSHTCDSFGGENVSSNMKPSDISSIPSPHMSCHIKRYDNVTNLTSEYDCTSWSFDSKDIISSPISEFQLVCDRAILKSHISMAFYLGLLVSNFGMAAVGDSFGRKPVACVILVFLCFSVGSVWAPNVFVFALLRFLTGIGSNVGQLKIIVVEIVGPTWRVFAPTMLDVMFSLGEVALSGLAYYIRDWKTLVLVVSVPSVLCLLYPFLLPESVRWLHAKGKEKKAISSLRRMSRSNSITLPETLTITKDPNPPRVTSEFVPFIKSPKVLLRWMINIYSWFVSGVLFVGLSLNVGTLGGNVYINFVVCGITELTAQVGCLCVSNRLRRKATTLTLFFVAGILSGISAFTTLYMDTVEWYWVLATTTIIGRMCASGGGTILFTYTSELFPTSMRSFFVSAGSVSFMFGGVVAPYIAYMGETVDVSYSTALPAIVYGSMAIFGGLLNMYLPETLKEPMPQAMTDLTDSTKDKNEERNVWSTNL